MSKKRDDTWKRFQGWRRVRQDHGWKLLQTFLSVLAEAEVKGHPEESTDFGQWVANKFLLAGSSKRLDGYIPVDFESSIKRACRDFGLDPTQPIHQKIMLGIFADSYYPNSTTENTKLMFRFQLAGDDIGQPERCGEPTVLGLTPGASDSEIKVALEKASADELVGVMNGVLAKIDSERWGPDKPTAPEYLRAAPPGAPRFWTNNRGRMFDQDVTKARRGPPQTIRANIIAQRLKKPKEFGPFNLDYEKLKLTALQKYIRRPPQKRVGRPGASRNLERK